MSTKALKITKKAIELAGRVMTPEQRLNTIVSLLLAEQEHRTKDEPIQLETEAFAILNDDIKLIKVSQFIRMVVYNDYSSLMLAGEPTEAQLSALYEDIMFQYQDAVMDVKTEIYTKTAAKIHELQIKMNRVNLNMQALMFARDEGIIGELKADGYNYPFTEGTYLKDIERIKTALKRDKIQCDKAKRQLSEMQGKGGSKKLTEDDFYANLAELRKFENYQSEPIKLADEMSLYGYAQALKRYNKDLELKKKQAERG
jgi:hypothetical protein